MRYIAVTFFQFTGHPLSHDVLGKLFARIDVENFGLASMSLEATPSMKEKTKNESLDKKRLLAAWNDEYREKILKC